MNEEYTRSPAKINKFADDLHTTWRIWKEMEEKGMLPRASQEPTPQGSEEGTSSQGGKKKRKSKGMKIDPSQLGFSVESNRIMKGQIEKPE